MQKMKQIVLDKDGKLQIPEDFQHDMGIAKGESLVMIENGREILIRKQVKKMEDRDEELESWTMASVPTMNKVWQDEPEGLWENFLTEEEKRKYDIKVKK